MILYTPGFTSVQLCRTRDAQGLALMRPARRGFLQHIFRVFLVSAHLEAEPVEFRLEQLDEFLECLVITIIDAGEQRLFLLV